MNVDIKSAPLAETTSSKDESGIQVIARAGCILRALADHPGGMGLGPLSRHVALPRSTVQRIVAALELERFVESGGPDGVRLGSGLAALAVNIQSSFAEQLKPLMQDLSSALGETLVLGRMRRREIIIVDQVIAERELTFRARVNGTFPLSCTAGGKALLAQMTDEAVTRLIGSELPRPTASSPPDLAALLADLAKVRQKGLAYDHETNGVGLCAVAVALPSTETSDWTHAVSVVVPTPRFRTHEVVRMEAALRAFRTAVVDMLKKSKQLV